ncbi:MAG: hypothetical protein R3B57_07280 [Phycisphaerales bacterium]
MTRESLIPILVLAAHAMAQPSGETIQLWGGGAPPPGNVVDVGEQGVRIVATSGASITLDWSVVRDVTGKRASNFEPLRETAENVWRAESRLARGDHVNAEPLFETLFDRYSASSGPTSSIVARGLLACRLHDGAAARAIAPWIGVLRAESFRPEGATPGAADDLIDPETGLVPALAPIWLATDEAAWLARTGVSPDLADSVEPGALRSRLRALQGLYALAARYEADPGAADAVRADLNELVSGLDQRTLREPGVQLVFEIVVSRLGAPEARASAQASLRARLNNTSLPSWREAWIRLALGRSLLLEQDAETRRRGIIQLLHVPARLADAPPRLAAIALAEAAVASKRLGDADAAETLRRELLDRYPGRPASDWAPIRDWSATPALGALTPSPTPLALAGLEPPKGPLHP